LNFATLYGAGRQQGVGEGGEQGESRRARERTTGGPAAGTAGTAGTEAADLESGGTDDHDGAGLAAGTERGRGYAPDTMEAGAVTIGQAADGGGGRRETASRRIAPRKCRRNRGSLRNTCYRIVYNGKEGSDLEEETGAAGKK